VLADDVLDLRQTFTAKDACAGGAVAQRVDGEDHCRRCPAALLDRPAGVVGIDTYPVQ